MRAGEGGVNMRCIAYLEDGRICGRSASHHDVRRGGMVCEDHLPFEVETAREIDRLNGIFVQRGAVGLIAQVADDLVKFRRILRSGKA
jgi:hypothetical protein